MHDLIGSRQRGPRAQRILPVLNSLGISIFVPENNIVITVKQIFFLRNRVSINHILSHQLNVIFFSIFSFNISVFLS